MKYFVLSVLLLAGASQATFSQDIYNKAMNALTARDTSVAIAAFQDAVKAGQKSAESNYHLGAIFYNRSKIDEAISALKASLRIDDENIDALKLIGKAYEKKGDAVNALNTFRKAARLAPRDPAINAAYGKALLQADSTDAAVVSLTRAREFAPDNPAIYEALGDAYMKQNVTVLGIQNYQKALGLDSSNVETHFKLAKAFEKDRKYNEAVKEYSDVIAIDSAFADAYFQEGRIFYLAKLYSNAIPPLQAYVRLRPDSYEGTLMLAKALSAANQNTEAAKMASRALQIDSSQAETWRVYFYALVETKNFQNAETALKGLEKRAKLEVQDYLKLGDLYFGLNKEDEALNWYLKAISADSTNCDPYFNLGFLYMKKQDYAQAAGMFEKKIACDPRSISAYINAGASYMQVKNYARARDLFLQAIELKPDYLQGRLWLARYYAQVDSLELAKEQYDLVLKEIGDNTDKYKREAGEANYLTGSYYFISKQYDRAAESFRKAAALGYENASLYLSWGQALILARGDDQDENRRKVEEAVKKFRRSIEMDPNNAQGHLWLAQGLVFMRIEGDNELNKKLTEEACSEYKKVLKLDPRNDDAKKGMTRIGCQ